MDTVGVVETYIIEGLKINIIPITQYHMASFDIPDKNLELNEFLLS